METAKHSSETIKGLPILRRLSVKLIDTQLSEGTIKAFLKEGYDRLGLTADVLPQEFTVMHDITEEQYSEFAPYHDLVSPASEHAENELNDCKAVLRVLDMYLSDLDLDFLQIENRMKDSIERLEGYLNG